MKTLLKILGYSMSMLLILEAFLLGNLAAFASGVSLLLVTILASNLRGIRDHVPVFNSPRAGMRRLAYVGLFLLGGYVSSLLPQESPAQLRADAQAHAQATAQAHAQANAQATAQVQADATQSAQARAAALQEARVAPTQTVQARIQMTHARAAQTATARAQATANAQATVAARPPTVHAYTMAAQYDNNKLAAQAYYTNHEVIVSDGTISNISQDILGNYYVAFNPTASEYYFGTHFQCFDSNQSELQALSKGQSISVYGTVQDMSLGIIPLNDCHVLPSN